MWKIFGVAVSELSWNLSEVNRDPTGFNNWTCLPSFLASNINSGESDTRQMTDFSHSPMYPNFLEVNPLNSS